MIFLRWDPGLGAHGGGMHRHVRAEATKAMCYVLDLG